MSAKAPTGYTKIINDLPKYFFFIAALALVIEFLPNQKGLISVLNREYKNTNTSINKKLEVGMGDSTEIIEEKVFARSDSELVDFKITKIIDGDTLEIQKEINGNLEKYKVRLLGINTPESVDPRRTVECFGKEASTYAEDNFKNKKVYLELDDTQDKYDKYDRLLAYVYLEDGQMLNRKLIADGFAYEYTYDKAYKYQKDFKDLQRFAKSESRGLWSSETCGGQK